MKRLIKVLAITLVLAVFGSSVLAADVNLPPAIKQAIESRVLISVYLTGDGGQKTLYSLGSGFVAGPAGYVVTVSHLFIQGSLFSALPENLIIEVQKNPNSEPTEAEIVQIDSRNDLALLKVKEPDKLGPTVKIAEIFPKDGETVYFSGFWAGKFNATLQAVILGRDDFSYNGFSVPYMAILDRTMPPGFSGGPVFNGKGELIGMNLMTAPTAGFGGIITVYPIQNILKGIK